MLGSGRRDHQVAGSLWVGIMPRLGHYVGTSTGGVRDDRIRAARERSWVSEVRRCPVSRSEPQRPQESFGIRFGRWTASDDPAQVARCFLRTDHVVYLQKSPGSLEPSDLSAGTVGGPLDRRPHQGRSRRRTLAAVLAYFGVTSGGGRGCRLEDCPMGRTTDR